MIRPFFWTATLMAMGCSGTSKDSPGTGDSATAWEPVSHVDAGELCVQGTATGIEVTVSVQDCLSSSCDRNLEGSCELVLNGSEVVVSSSIEWETAVGAQTCTDDCGLPATECTLDLPDGTYTVTLGGESAEITLPATETTSCDFW